MQKNTHILSLIISLTFLLFKGINAQEITDAKIKSGFIYKFLENVKWENEEGLESFKVGVYSADEALNSSIKSLETLTIKNKKIEVVFFSNIIQVTPCQIVMVSYENRNEAAAVYEQVHGTQTLLVTDRCEQTRFFMFNFIHTEDGKVEFEINPKNMADENLYASPKLLLIGGKEIDVRKLYLQTEQSLKDEKVKSETFEQELAVRQKELQQLKQQLESLNMEIIKQNALIDTQNLSIGNQKRILQRLLHQIDEQEKILNAKTSQNQQLAMEIHDNETALKIKDTEILQKDSNLLTKQSTIDEYTGFQKELKEKINSQLARIHTQQLVLYLVMAILLLCITFGILMYRNYRIRKETNKTLEKLSIVASETDNAVVIMDKNGKIEWLNEGFTRLYGHSLKDLIKTRGDNILKASYNTDIARIFDSCTKTKKSITYETPVNSKNNTRIFIQSTLTPIFDKSKNITKLVSIGTDISNIKYAEEKIMQKNHEIQAQADALASQTTQLSKANIILEEQKEKLQETLLKLQNTQTQLVESEKMASLGLLTAGIAHEINNPINFINAGIDGLNVTLDDLMVILKKHDEITDDNVHSVLAEINTLKQKLDYDDVINGLSILLNNIKVGANRATEIVKSLKTFARLDEGELRFSDIHENIESSLVMLRNLYKDKVDIIKKYGNLPKIECYPGKINQALLNIILNSLQAIDNKGTITISTRVEKEKDKTIAIEIEDTGHGMDDEVKTHIFDPFFTTKEVGRGSGLGLSITRSIIEKHSGNIEVISEVGKGTKFVIYLPIHRDEFA